MSDIDPQFAHEGSALRIWRDVAPNTFLSEKEGRPIFDEVILVEVISPGSRGSIPVFEAKRYFDKAAGEGVKPRLGACYDKYKTYIDQFEKDEEIDSSMSGTPLKEWSEMSKSLVATLRANKIFTVEALAALPDSNLNAVGPDGRTWRAKAQAYIETASNSAHATHLAAQLELAKQDIADKDAALKEMSDRMTAMEAALASGDTSKPKKAKAETPADPLAPII